MSPSSETIGSWPVDLPPVVGPLIMREFSVLETAKSVHFSCGFSQNHKRQGLIGHHCS